MMRPAIPAKAGSESEYVLVKHSPSLTPHKSFDVSATINVGPGFEPSFAAGIVQKGFGLRMFLSRSFKERSAYPGHSRTGTQQCRKPKRGCTRQMDDDSCDLRQKPGASIHRRQAGWFSPVIWSETRERGGHYHWYQIYRQNRGNQDSGPVNNALFQKLTRRGATTTL
jgi:hypothetical protein